MNGRGREQFRQIIAAEAEPSGHARPDEVLDPLQDLVGAINESGVGAELVPGPGGRLTLTLWPRHRPALRSLMLPFVHDHGEVIVLLSAGRRSFQTADELRGVLTEFAGRPEFKASLAYLRDQAQQPVEAVLRSVDHSPPRLGVRPRVVRRRHDLRGALQLAGQVGGLVETPPPAAPCLTPAAASTP